MGSAARGAPGKAPFSHESRLWGWLRAGSGLARWAVGGGRWAKRPVRLVGEGCAEGGNQKEGRKETQGAAAIKPRRPVCLPGVYVYPCLRPPPQGSGVALGVGVDWICQVPARSVRSIELPAGASPTSGALAEPVSSISPLPLVLP